MLIGFIPEWLLGLSAHIIHGSGVCVLAVEAAMHGLRVCPVGHVQAHRLSQGHISAHL